MTDPDPGVLSWGCCNGAREDCDFVVCRSCNKGYHIECILAPGTQSNEEFLSPNWLCPACSKPKGSNVNTPVRSNSNVAVRPLKRAALNSPPQVNPEMEALTRNDLKEVVEDLFMREMGNLLLKMTNQMKVTLCTELSTLKKDIQDLNTSISHINEQCNEASTDIKSLKIENDTIRLVNRDLTIKLNHLEQHARGCNVEFQCVPERKTENIISIVTQVAKTIGCVVLDENILSCSRIAKLNPNSTRPRSIVVSFSSPRLRDTFLASAIKFNKTHIDNKLNSTHVGIAGDKSPIYIMEHLSSANKSLHAAARAKAKELAFKHVWVRSGRIYMRKTDTSDHKFIKDIETLNKLGDT